MSKKENGKLNKIKVIGTLFFMVACIFFVTCSTQILKQPNDIFIVEKGSISYEEGTEAYILRDETVLQGENYKNGMVQIASENERVAKGEKVFRYYSDGEEDLIEQIAELDTKINEAIASSGLKSLSSASDIVNLESQIESNLENMYGINEIQKIQEYKKKIENYMSKKAQISGEASPEGSEVKKLIEQRSALERTVDSSSELISTDRAGLVSYKVDGLEEILKIDDFSYLNKDLLDSFDLKVGAVIPQSTEKGKIVNNYECYIAVCMNTERALSAKVGEKVTIRLSNTDEVSAEIAYASEADNNGRILVFKIKDDVEKLIEYRKISLDIIWWKYTGFKVSNDAILKDGDKTYIERSKAGYTDKILVKVERQNETYSIVKNYTNDELLELGYTEEEVSNMKNLKVKLYDEIILH